MNSDTEQNEKKKEIADELNEGLENVEIGPDQIELENPDDDEVSEKSKNASNLVTERVQTPVESLAQDGARYVGIDPATVTVKDVKIVDGELVLILRGEVDVE